MTDQNRRDGGKNPDRPPTSEYPDLSRLIVSWYRENRRRLPWREEVSPYRTLLSEIMLQQTRVEAVKPYFERFLDAFPDIPSLADADDELLMKKWEGLGYYSRARNLKKCAGRTRELMAISGKGNCAKCMVGVPCEDKIPVKR